MQYHIRMCIKLEQESEKSDTKTEVVVKPDGSRVLVMTMKVGGMESTVSLQLTKPTDFMSNSKVVNEKMTDTTDSSVSEQLTQVEEK